MTNKYIFIGLSPHTGATTLAYAFADFLIATHKTRDKQSPNLSQTPIVAVVDICDTPGFIAGFGFDKIGGHRRFAGREFSSVYERIANGGSVRHIVNLDGGINWLLRLPTDANYSLDPADFNRLTDNVCGINVIADISGSFGTSFDSDRDRIEALRRIITDADRVFIIVDPSPSAMMTDRTKLELFKACEAKGTNISYIANKMNSGVYIKQVRRFLKANSLIEIEHFPPGDVYRVEYNCETIYAHSDIRKTLQKTFEAMM